MLEWPDLSLMGKGWPRQTTTVLASGCYLCTPLISHTFLHNRVRWRFAEGVLHSRNVIDDFRNLFGNLKKFGNNIEIWKLEIRSKQNLIGFAAPAILCAIETCKNQLYFWITMKYWLLILCCPIQDARIKVILTITTDTSAIHIISVTNYFWSYFINNFNSERACTFHLLCPCYRCTGASVSINFNQL